MSLQFYSDNKLRQLIAIAAQKAGYDTKDPDVYSEYRRVVLQQNTGKTSTKTMNSAELRKVLQHFMSRGFKLTAPKTASKKHNAPWLKKLLSIWYAMHEQGFVNCGEFSALEKWALKQIGEKAASKLEWNHRHANMLIERLKKFHADRMLKNAEALFSRFYQVVVHEPSLTATERKAVANIQAFQVVPETTSYQALADWYQKLFRLVKKYEAKNA